MTENPTTGRTARVIPEDDRPFFEEELRLPLSDRDRDLFLALLDNPPPPNEALCEAARRYRNRQG